MTGKNDKLVLLYDEKTKGSENKNISKNEVVELSKPKFDFGIY